MAIGSEKKCFAYAVATLSGTIIGVGVFGVPFVVAQAGFIVGVFYLVTIAFLALFIHLAYAETILRTSQPHRLIGYTAKYLGQKYKKFATGVLLIEYYGIILAYMIVGGQFLNIIFSRWFSSSELACSVIFFAIGSWAIFSGLKTVAKSEMFFTILLFGVAALISGRGILSLNLSNLAAIDWAKFFLPYGVIFFSFSGTSAIPEIRQILNGQENKIKPVIILGTLIPLVVYLFFVLAVVGVSGKNTSPEAIEGLIPFFGSGMIVLGAVFGILAIFTSLIVTGLNLKRIFQYDYHIKSLYSFILAMGLPLVLYLFGFKNFIGLISFIGAVMVGIDGILTILVYLKAKKFGDRHPEFFLSKKKGLAYMAIFLFILGIIYHLVSLGS